jgi:hypothetical protein
LPLARGSADLGRPVAASVVRFMAESVDPTVFAAIVGCDGREAAGGP